MINNFRHKGLREVFERGTSRRVEQNYIRRCQEILAVLHAATNLQQINLPNYRLHNLKPSRPLTWSVTVQGAWRITFEFRNGTAYDVDLEQYH